MYLILDKEIARDSIYNEFRKSIGLTEEITDVAYLDIIKVVVDPIMHARPISRGNYFNYNSYKSYQEEETDA